VYVTVTATDELFLESIKEEFQQPEFVQKFDFELQSLGLASVKLDQSSAVIIYPKLFATTSIVPINTPENNTPLIVGVVVGILGLAILIASCYWCAKTQKVQETQSKTSIKYTSIKIN
jgi:hypothetical protein